MTLDKSHFSRSSEDPLNALFIREIFQMGPRDRGKMLERKDAGLGEIQLVRFEPPPKGVDSRLVREAARLEGDKGVTERQKLAIQILQAASEMEDATDRTGEVAKLSVLFKLGLTKKDKDTREMLASLLAKDEPSQDDCKVALKKVEPPPPKEDPEKPAAKGAVDIRDVREAARLEGDRGVTQRKKFAIQILEAASQMEDVKDRKIELAKLETLFRLSEDKRDKETWASLASLVAKGEPSQEDCKVALKKFEAAAPKEDGSTAAEKVKKLLKTAQTIAYPDDLAKQTAERKKLLEQAAEVYNMPKDSKPPYSTLFMYWRLKNPANPNDNNEIDVYLALLDRVDPFKPTLVAEPYFRTLGVMLDTLKEADFAERRKILEAFKKDDAYKGDEKVQKVIDGLLEKKLTDLEIQSYVKDVAIPTFFPAPPPPPKNDPWYLSNLVTYPLGALATWLIGRQIPIVKWPIRGVEWLVKKGFEKGVEKAKEYIDRSKTDDATSRLRDDKMSQDKTRSAFKSEAEAAIRGLDPKHPDAGKKLSKMMNDFAAVENLDRGVADGTRKIEVKFADAVDASDGMLKCKIEMPRDGNITLTFPKDASPSDMAHDCHLALYEIERSGKGGLKTADRAAVARLYTRLGVDLTGRSDASARDASARLPDRGTGPASADPIKLEFTADGVTVGKVKYPIDKVTEAIRDELKDKFDRLKDEGKREGDPEYDAAKKAYEEHRQLAEDLKSGDTTRQADARTKALEKVKSAFEADDGKVADRFREDLRKAGGEEKGRSRAVVLSMLAARYATPLAAGLVGVGLFGGDARGAEIKRAPIIPIIKPKKEDK